MQDPAAEDVPGERVHQGAQQRGRLPDPVGERRALQFHALAGVDPALAVERQVVGVLRHQHMGEQARRRAAAADGQARRRRSGDPLAGPARPAGADVADDAEPARHVVEDFGRVLAEAAQAPAAGGAGAGVGAVLHRLPRQVLREGAARGFAALQAPLAALRAIISGRRWRNGRVRLQILERQFDLVGLGRDALGGAAESGPAEAGELQAQPPDDLALARDLGVLGEHDRAQRPGVVRQEGGIEVHGRIVARAPASRRMNPARAATRATTLPSPAASCGRASASRSPPRAWIAARASATPPRPARPAR